MDTQADTHFVRAKRYWLHTSVLLAVTMWCIYVCFFYYEITHYFAQTNTPSIIQLLCGFDHSLSGTTSASDPLIQGRIYQATEIIIAPVVTLLVCLTRLSRFVLTGADQCDHRPPSPPPRHIQPLIST